MVKVVEDKAVQARDLLLDVPLAQFTTWQKEDLALTHAWSNAVHNIREEKPGQKALFLVKKGLLYCQGPGTQKQRGLLQLLIPQQVRPFVLLLTHDILLAGHLGVEKTISQVLQYF